MSHFRKEEPYTSRLNHVKGVTPPLGAPHKNMKGDAKHKALASRTNKKTRKAASLESRSKKAGHYVQGHKNFGDVYEA